MLGLVKLVKITIIYIFLTDPNDSLMFNINILNSIINIKNKKPNYFKVKR